MTAQQPACYIDGPHGRLAYRMREGDMSRPGIVWFGGYRSDMLGSKANALDAFCRRDNIGFLRFDYAGHGESSGDFEDGTIGKWTRDARTVIEAVFERPLIIVGSSMGAWTSTLFALARPELVHGAVYIAPAPDFTEKLMVPTFTQDQISELERTGRLEIPSDYSGDPYIYTKAFLDDGVANAVMTKDIALRGDIRILHGLRDEVVPLSHVVEFIDTINSDRVQATLVKDGDHRLSTDANLELLWQTIQEVCAGIDIRN